MGILRIRSLLVVSFFLSAVASAAGPNALPANVKVIHHGKRLSLDAQATIATLPKHKLYCEFWSGTQLFAMPDAFMIYNPKTQSVLTRTGSPATTKAYNNVTVEIGVPPYGDEGYTVKIFGDVPVVSIKQKKYDTIPLLAYALDDHEATWGKVPGFPNPKFNVDNGLCFDDPLFKDDFRNW
jgi:hypothetical protein